MHEAIWYLRIMEHASSPARLKVRFAIFVAVVVFLQLGPFVRQVLKLDIPLRPWRMFHYTATDICDVDFVVRTPDGEETRPMVEDVMREIHMKNPLRLGSDYRLTNTQEIRFAGRKYCALHPGIELQAIARCGHHHKGWVDKMHGEKDLCLRKD